MKKQDMDHRNGNDCLFAAALLLVSAFCLSCRHNPTGEVSLESRMATLRNPANVEALSREQAYFADSLDMEDLFASPLRNDYITAWVASFASPDIVPAYCATLFGRVAGENPALLNPLVAGICRVLKERGAEQAAGSVATLPFGIDAAQNPVISGRLLTSILLPGTDAPDITGLVPANGQPAATILLFHKSNCRTCQALIWEIREEYGRLLENGVRVVTVSTDKDEQEWKEYATTLPWPDKLCDYLGFYSPNMKSWGVAAVPTLFLIDGAGKVVDRYDTADRLWKALLEGENDETIKMN